MPSLKKMFEIKVDEMTKDGDAKMKVATTKEEKRSCARQLIA